MKYGVFIGLNYVGTEYELAGCVKDAKNLARRIGANVSDIFTSINFDTLQDVLSARKYKAKDTVYFCFSGHGSLVGGESCIVLEKNNQLEFVENAAIDQLLNKLGCRIVCVWDCCNAGGLAKKVSDVSKKKSIPYIIGSSIVKAETRVYKSLISPYNCELFACQADEFAYDSPEGGLFTLGLWNSIMPVTSAMTAYRFAKENCKGKQNPAIRKSYNPQLFKFI